MKEFLRSSCLGLSLAAIVILWSGCGPTSESETEPSEPVSTITPPPRARPDHHTSRDSLDWDGTYTGKGRTLTLASDGSFIFVMAGAEPIVGDFEWSGDGSSIMILGAEEGPLRFLVGENVLVEIDEEGQPVGGDDPEAGRLIKAAPEAPAPAAAAQKLEGRRWVLFELRGRAVERIGEDAQEIYLEFDAAEGRAFGFGGCNRFSGPFEIKDGFWLRFGNLMSTLMACPDQEIEQEWFAVLREIDNFTVSEDGSTLSLNKARMAPLARLRAK